MYKYQTIALSLKDEIARLNPGDKLPSVDKLRKRFGVGTATIQRALDEIPDAEKAGVLREPKGRRGNAEATTDDGEALPAISVMTPTKTLVVSTTEISPKKMRAWGAVADAFERECPGVRIQLNSAEQSTPVADVYIMRANLLEQLRRRRDLVNLNEFLDFDDFLGGDYPFAKELLGKEQINYVPVHYFVPVSIYSSELATAKLFAKPAVDITAVKSALEEIGETDGYLPPMYAHGDMPFLLMQQDWVMQLEDDAVKLAPAKTFEKVVSLLRELRHADVPVLVPTASLGRSGRHRVLEPVAEGRSCAFLTTNSFLEFINVHSEEEPLRVGASPLAPGGKNSVIPISAGVDEETKLVYEALEFVRFASSRTGQQILAQHDILPTWLDVAESDHFAPPKREGKSVQVHALRNAVLNPFEHYELQFRIFHEIVLSKVTAHLHRESSPEELAREIAASAKLFIKTRDRDAANH